MPAINETPGTLYRYPGCHIQAPQWIEPPPLSDAVKAELAGLRNIVRDQVRARAKIKVEPGSIQPYSDLGIGIRGVPIKPVTGCLKSVYTSGEDSMRESTYSTQYDEPCRTTASGIVLPDPESTADTLKALRKQAKRIAKQIAAVKKQGKAQRKEYAEAEARAKQQREDRALALDTLRRVANDGDDADALVAARQLLDNYGY